MNHKHAPTQYAKARVLGGCNSLSVTFCICGAFRVPGSTIWIAGGKTGRVSRDTRPENGYYLTLPQAAAYLGLSHRTMYMVTARGFGHKRCLWKKRRWVFTTKELDTFRTQAKRERSVAYWDRFIRRRAV